MSGSFARRGGWWVAVQFLLLLVIATLGIYDRGSLQIQLLLACGAVFLAIAALCGLAGLISLGRNLTPFPRPSAKTQLVRHGIYGWIRHPLYTSVMCAAIGWSLVWQSWPALSASLVLVIFLDAKARHEEQWLRKAFPDYATYAQRVRRFVPGVY